MWENLGPMHIDPTDEYISRRLGEINCFFDDKPILRSQSPRICDEQDLFVIFLVETQSGTHRSIGFGLERFPDVFMNQQANTPLGFQFGTV